MSSSNLNARVVLRLVAALVIAGGWLFPAGVLGAEPFRYPEAQVGGGELKYLETIPVLTVSGSPEEIGQQVAALAVRPAKRLLDYPRDSMKRWGIEAWYPGIVDIGRSMLPRFPADHRQEMETIIRNSAAKPEDVIAGNTMFDIKKFIACSTISVDAAKSATGGALLGRNLDFDTLGYLQDYTLVTVYRPDGKHAFASIGFPGVVGCLSAMNDAGLAIAVLEVSQSKDRSATFDAKGVPYALCYRRIMEECTTIDEAFALLKSVPRTTMTNLAVCDGKTGVVFEITTKQVVMRKPQASVCPCTNHFRSRELGLDSACRRFAALSTVDQLAQVRISDIHRRLDQANQGRLTLQTMVFEPAALKLHLAIGPTPTSRLPLRMLELSPLLKPHEVRTAEKR